MRRQHLITGLFLLSALLASSPTSAIEPKRVMILSSFGGNFKPWSEYTKHIRAELERQSPWQLEIIEHPLISSHSPNKDSEGIFAEYLGALFAKYPLDLIVSIGAPAAAFVQQRRHTLFAPTPMVFTAVEQRRVQYSTLTANDTVVAVKHDLPAIIENILQLLPETKTITVVNGASPLEQFWLAEMRREFKAFENRVDFAWTSDLSFEVFIKRAAALPPRSAIFWELMIVDAAGIAHEGNKALAKLHHVSNAPIFSFDDSFFGSEIVGGPMHSVRELSEQTVAIIIRILGGEKAGDIKTLPLGFATPKYDWREMQRWGIKESRLPPGGEIYFRSPSPWRSYRWQIAAITTALVMEAMLIFWLLYEHRQRLRAEVRARNTMSELTHMNRLATAGELSASIAHEVNQPLAGIVVYADTAVRWLTRATPNIDEAVTSLKRIASEGMRASEIVQNIRAMFKHQEIEKSDVDLSELILSVLNLMRMDLQKHNIRLVSLIDQRLPHVVGNRVQLQQVILNLIMNAIEAMNAVQDRVLHLRVRMDQPNAVLIAIQDTGKGIAPDDLPRLFQPMFTTKSRGMGMGLSICQSIIQEHEGRIWVTSEVGEGSVFQFELPVKTL